MYCLTYDMVETGIFYNKDIFKKLGLNIPKDWTEFEKVQDMIQKAGIIPFLAGSDAIADWGMDLIFDQVYGGILPGLDLHKDPVRELSLEGYLDWDEIAYLAGKGYFTRRDPRYVETFRILKKWRRYWQKDMTSDLSRPFMTQKAAMWWNGSWAVNRLSRDPSISFEWGVFYLPPIPTTYSRFADGHEQVVIGGAGTQFEITKTAFNDTHDPTTSVKLQRSIAFLQFLTVPRNTDLVVNEILAFLPNVNGVEPNPALLPFHEFLQRKCSKTKWLYTFDLRFNEIFKRMLDLYLNNGIGEGEFMEWMETNVRTASETVVQRKHLDLSKFDSQWQKSAPMRAGMTELPGAR
jgi:raffinose/stachyose/melibiose transport system substrate-binding protein